MTQRSIKAAGELVIIKAGGSVTVRGHAGDTVTAESSGSWGLSLQRRSAAEIARARAAIGENVLFDLRFKNPLSGKQAEQEVIEIQIGSSGEVQVPFASNLKVYAGKAIDVQGIRGQVDAFAGTDLRLKEVAHLGNASAGGAMFIDCESLPATKAEFKAGRDLRFHVRDLTSARLRVRDLGGYWEARIGQEEKSLYLKSNGEVTLVTDQVVEALPPDYVLGKIEKPQEES